MTPALKPATYQDVVDAPEGMIAEIIDGNLQLQPRPAPSHARACSLLSARLISSFGSDFDGNGPGGWVIVFEPELHLHKDIVVPDLAGWRIERYATPDEAFWTLPPDWCCEILSPATQTIDRIAKSALYAREGVGFYWLIDPVEKWIEAFELLPNSQWALVGVFAGDEGARIRPFDAIELPMPKLWGH